MRVKSFNRPKEKLRGIKRRLKAFDKWADSFKGYFPFEHANEKFWNCKISILDRLVNPPTTNKALQAHCARAMLRAAEFLDAEKSKHLQEAQVTVLLTYPNMFDSELCIFFDEVYFEQFFIRNNAVLTLTPLVDKSLVKQLNIDLPKSFNETGFQCIINDEWDGESYQTVEEWWSYQL